MYCIYNFRKLFDILLRSKLNRIFFMGRRKEKKKEKKTKKPANDRDWTTMIGLYFQCTSV